MKTAKKILWLVVIGIVITVGVIVVLKREWILDWWKGLSYEPSAEMAAIRDSLSLTGEGEFLFKASAPKLSEREEFNANCREILDEEMSVLGCYTDGDIYVYNIQSSELKGIREVTTAHELLHAVWKRMADGEKQELNRALHDVLAKNRELLEKELNNYNELERQEELFVRAGTEVKDLPAELEKFYARFFADQDSIAAFYESYISVFREIENEMREIEARLKELEGEIERQTTEYEQNLARLEANIALFNDCAEKMGCFSDEMEFYSRRAVLVGEQEALLSAYDTINNMIAEYNDLVNKYNADVTRTDKLNTLINSAVKPEAV